MFDYGLGVKPGAGMMGGYNPMMFSGYGNNMNSTMYNGYDNTCNRSPLFNAFSSLAKLGLCGLGGYCLYKLGLKTTFGQNLFNKSRDLVRGIRPTKLNTKG